MNLPLITGSRRDGLRRSLPFELRNESHHLIVGVPAAVTDQTATGKEIVTARPRRGLSPRQLRRLKEYAAAHLDRRIGLDELASLTSLSRSYFCTAFRLAMDCTAQEWLAGERISRAQELLERSEIPVTEVALAVGYQTHSAFSNVFRKRIGMTPSEFRRSQ